MRPGSHAAENWGSFTEISVSPPRSADELGKGADLHVFFAFKTGNFRLSNELL